MKDSFNALPFSSQDEFPASDELADEFPSVLKWRSKPAVASMSASLPDLLGNSSSNLSSPDKPVKPEQLLEGDKTQHPRLQSKLTICPRKSRKCGNSICSCCIWGGGQLFASKSA